MLITIKKILGGKEGKNASWLIGGKIAQMGISFFVSIFTARYLGPSNFGLMNYAGAYIAFFTSFCTLGINSIIIKEFIDNQDRQGEIIGTSLFLRLTSSILSAFMIIGIVSIIDKNEPVTLAVVALSCIALVFQVFDTFNYWFQSRYESKISAIATFAAYVITTIYRIVLLIMGKSVEWFAFASSVDFICIAIVLCLVYHKKSGPKLSLSLTRGKQLLSRSYHYILSGMMVAIYAQTDKFMLKHMLDETVVGYYSLASSINHMWVFVLAAIIDSMYPTIMRLYKNNRDAYEKKNRQLYALVIYISLFVALVLFIFGGFAIKVLYGEQFLPSETPLKIVTLYTVFSYLGVARNAWIVCENKQKYLKYIYFSAAIINVFMNLLLIPIWGASGAALASLLTQICTSMIIPFLIKDMRPNVILMLDAFKLKDIW